MGAFLGESRRRAEAFRAEFIKNVQIDLGTEYELKRSNETNNIDWEIFHKGQKVGTLRSRISSGWSDYYTGQWKLSSKRIPPKSHHQYAWTTGSRLYKKSSSLVAAIREFCYSKSNAEVEIVKARRELEASRDLVNRHRDRAQRMLKRVTPRLILESPEEADHLIARARFWQRVVDRVEQAGHYDAYIEPQFGRVIQLADIIKMEKEGRQ